MSLSKKHARQSLLRSRNCKLDHLEFRRLLALSPELVIDINSNTSDSFITGPVTAGNLSYFAGNSQLWRLANDSFDFEIVADFRTEVGSSPLITALTPFGDRVVFNLSDDLWVSDGTSAGTEKLVEDLTISSLLQEQSPAILNGKLIFAGTRASGDRESELWQTDGTISGTMMVADISPGPDSSRPGSFVSLHDRVYFVATEPGTGTELWETDGTLNGTHVLKDLHIGSESTEIGPLVAASGMLFFRARDLTSPPPPLELWTSDGTDLGTVPLADIVPALSGKNIGQLHVFLDVVYFTVSSPGEFVQLWRSDGSADGTYSLGTLQDAIHSEVSMTQLGDQLLIAVQTAAGGVLWSTDGVSNLEKAVEGGWARVWLSPGGSTNTYAAFFGEDKDFGSEVWRTDGTEAGTYLLRDIAPGSVGSYGYALHAVNGRVYFPANDRRHGKELWSTDGSQSGTELVIDLNGSQMASSFPKFLAATSDRVYFTAVGGEGSCGIWSTDGSAFGTQEVCEPGDGQWLGVEPAFAAGDHNFFYLADKVGVTNPDELWVTNASNGATTQLLNSGVGAWSRFSVIGDTAYFGADTTGKGIELWHSDGTPGGTSLVKDIAPGPNSSDPRYFTEFQGKVFFTAGGPADTSVHSTGLWMTDGTAQGTQHVATNADGSSLNPRFLTRVGNQLFFQGLDPAHGFELWVSDGTTEGTRLVRDLNPGPGHSYPRNFMAFNGSLYFTTTNTDFSTSFWRTDGTPEGTVSINTPAPSLPGVVANGLLFYGARNDGTSGWLWRTDGTPEGTFALPQPEGTGRLAALGDRLLNVQGTVFTIASLSGNRNQIWRTDGTIEGTQFVYELPFGFLGNKSFAAVENQVLFVNKDEEHGEELWRLRPPVGDTNFDGMVDLTDLNNVRNHFGESGNVTGDANGDGVVDLADLNAVRNNFGGPPTVPSLATSKAQTTQLQPSGKPLSTQALDVIAHLLGTDRDGFIPLRRRPEGRVRQF